MKKINKTIIIIGSKGMLGSQVLDFFKRKNCSTYCFNERINEKNIKKKILLLNKKKPSIIINCIGKIKQKPSTLQNLFFINSYFPYMLSKYLDKKHYLVHPSTDCVFNGKKQGPYKKNHNFDADDNYGVSKFLGEKSLHSRNNTLILRVSIIGHTKNNKDYLSWALKNKSKKLFGFKNHYWNGITTLEWCKKLEKILLNKKSKSNKIVQLGTKEKYTKYQMLILFKKIFNLKYNVSKKNVEYINRILKPDTYSKNLEKQLYEFKEYWKI